MFDKIFEEWMKTQQKMMSSFSEIAPKTGEAFKGVQNATEAFKSQMAGDAEKWTRFMENSIKFQKAYIAQQQAMMDMMEAMTENAKILYNPKNENK